MQFFSVKAIRTRDNLHKTKRPRLEMTEESEGQRIKLQPKEQTKRRQGVAGLPFLQGIGKWRRLKESGISPLSSSYSVRWKAWRWILLRREVFKNFSGGWEGVERVVWSTTQGSFWYVPQESTIIRLIRVPGPSVPEPLFPASCLACSPKSLSSGETAIQSSWPHNGWSLTDFYYLQIVRFWLKRWISLLSLFYWLHSF